jgi:hypothetical protein
MIEQEIIESLGKEMQEAIDFTLLAEMDKYPVPVRLSNDQWNWLCDTIGTPQRDWMYNFGHVWFLKEEHKTLWLLRWA